MTHLPWCFGCPRCCTLHVQASSTTEHPLWCRHVAAACSETRTTSSAQIRSAHVQVRLRLPHRPRIPAVSAAAGRTPPGLCPTTRPPHPLTPTRGPSLPAAAALHSDAGAQDGRRRSCPLRGSCPGPPLILAVPGRRSHGVAAAAPGGGRGGAPEPGGGCQGASGDARPGAGGADAGVAVWQPAVSSIVSMMWGLAWIEHRHGLDWFEVGVLQEPLCRSKRHAAVVE